MIKPESAISALNKKVEDLSNINDKEAFYVWQKATSSTLQNIYPNNEDIKRKIEDISPIHRTLRSTDDVTYKAIKDANSYLQSLISDIQYFGLPHLNTVNKNDKVNVIVTQENNQNQSTSVSINIDFIIDILKGELRNSEIEEVKEILESGEKPKEKKKKFIDKIKSFGSDVASNILANILTNPQVYEQIGKML
ncbi:MAG TPA: hypothetical protein VJ780_04605 [Flavobacterium sp.]|nr:hypothetical protein [Flavobacterium sp.]